MSLTPPADAPLPWRLASDDDGIDCNYVIDARNDAVVDLADAAYADVIRYLVAAANAAPGLVAERDAAEAVLRERTNMLRAERMLAERDRDTALARVAELEAQNSRLRSTLEGIAERDCEYYDNCPSNARHYVCDVCRASRALETP